MLPDSFNSTVKYVIVQKQCLLYRTYMLLGVAKQMAAKFWWLIHIPNVFVKFSETNIQRYILASRNGSYNTQQLAKLSKLQMLE